MRTMLAALMAAPLLLTGVPAHAEAGPALIDHVEWADWQGRPSLRVYPLPAARAAAVRLGAVAEGERAWSEVLTRAPEAATPGMREQFLCHWQYAELAQPGKTSWNLEPWRPVVDEVTMLDAGCNPGAAEEPF